MDRIKLNNRNKSVMLSHSYGRISHTSFLEVWITKLLAKNWVRKGWKEIKAGKRVRGWLRGRGCVGDEEVRGQRSAPLVISPAPERQSRPGQRRFRCQRETTDWQDQAGPLLRSVPLGPFILPSLPFPVTPPWPIPPFLQTLLALLAVCLPTEPQSCHPLVLSLLPFPPLTFFFTPQAKHYHSVSLSRPGWLGQLSVGLHVFSPPSCAHIHTQKHPRAPICTQVVGMQPKVWQEHSEYLRSFYILGLIFRVVAMTPVLKKWTPPDKDVSFRQRVRPWLWEKVLYHCWASLFHAPGLLSYYAYIWQSEGGFRLDANKLKLTCNII